MTATQVVSSSTTITTGVQAASNGTKSGSGSLQPEAGALWKRQSQQNSDNRGASEPSSHKQIVQQKS